ncbi:MAG: FUN14 domain-containing protein [Candidatus Bathyarchaeia archaeon]
MEQGAANLVLATLMTEATAGGIIGFLVGYGLRKIVGTALKVTAMAVALFTIPPMALAALGVVQVDFAALARLLERLFTRLAQFAIAVSPSMVRMFPVNGSFAFGLVVGAMKG